MVGKTLVQGCRSPLVRLAVAATMVASLGVADAFAEPPPWAPAHGHRAKHKGKGGPAHGQVPETAGVSVPFDIDAGRCNRQVLGTVLGGAAGAAVGSTVGSGDGQTAAIVGGAIIGALVGGSIGRHMDRVDQNCIGQSLEYAEDGQTVWWKNSEADAQYGVTPLQTYQDSQQRYCREYRTTALVDGRAQQIFGIACRQPDGSWELRT